MPPQRERRFRRIVRLPHLRLALLEHQFRTKEYFFQFAFQREPSLLFLSFTCVLARETGSDGHSEVNESLRPNPALLPNSESTDDVEIPLCIHLA